jgi:hypothetical protein
LRAIVSLQRTVGTPPLVDFCASRLWILLSSLQQSFQEPARSDS